jgi:hypothetical protein
VYAVVEDPQKSSLLFAGTEFGLFFSVDGGRKWVQLKGGLPTIAVRDLAIQARESDLAVATFGRGFYILDDYAPLREVTPELLDQAASVFPVRQAWMFIPTLPYGWKGKGFLGEGFYAAPNPPFGAAFTYYLKDELKTRRKARQEQEKKTAKAGGDVFYPSWDALRAEDREEAPAVVLTVSDEAGNVVRSVTGPVTAGFHRVAWDLRYPPPDPATLQAAPTDDPFSDPPMGPLAAPGKYTVSVATRVDGRSTAVGEPQTFQAVPVGTASLPPADRSAMLAFAQQTASLQRAVLGASRLADDLRKQLTLVRKAVDDTPRADAKLRGEVAAIDNRLRDIQVALGGDSVVARYNEPTLPGIADRVSGIIAGQWVSTSAPTDTSRQQYAIAAEQFAPVLEHLRRLVEVDIEALENRLEVIGAPWTPGRVPKWTPGR